MTLCSIIVSSMITLMADEMSRSYSRERYDTGSCLRARRRYTAPDDDDEDQLSLYLSNRRLIRLVLIHRSKMEMYTEHI